MPFPGLPPSSFCYSSLVIDFFGRPGLSGGAQESFGLWVRVVSSSLTRDRVWAPRTGSSGLSHWAAREVPPIFFKTPSLCAGVSQWPPLLAWSGRKTSLGHLVTFSDLPFPVPSLAHLSRRWRRGLLSSGSQPGAAHNIYQQGKSRQTSAHGHVDRSTGTVQGRNFTAWGQRGLHRPASFLEVLQFTGKERNDWKYVLGRAAHAEL